MTDTLHLLEKHFDTAFAAPDGVKKLRELILTLAMQGKLVPQDPNDEPASELLKKIEAEKQRSIQDGKLKKAKPLPEIKPEEIPYELPEGWEWVRLNSVAIRIHYGYTASANYSLNEFRLLRITDIQNNMVQWKSVPGCHISAEEAEQYLLNDNDILIARTGGTVGKSYLIKNINLKAVFASYLIRVIPTKKIDVNYLKLFIESPLYWSQLYEKCSGTGQPNVNGTSLSTLLVALPPLAEQKRIVEKIDRLMARCDELEQKRSLRDQKRLTVHRAAINCLLNSPENDGRAWQFIAQNFKKLYSTKENITELRKAILQLGVMGKLVPQDPNDEPASELLKAIEAEKQQLIKEGKLKKSKHLPEIKPEEIPYDLPESWKWVRLGDITLSTDSGWSPECLKESRHGNQWGVLKVSAVSWGVFRPEENKALPLYQQPRKEYEVQPGDFLMSRANTEDLVARSVVVVDTPSRLMMSDKIVRFTLSQKINKQFINFSNISQYARIYYAMNSSGTSSSMKNVSREVILRLPIPIPPSAEQKRIVEKIDRLMALCDRLEQHLEASTHQQTRLLEAVMALV